MCVCVGGGGGVDGGEISKYFVTRSMFKNVLCSVKFAVCSCSL